MLCADTPHILAMSIVLLHTDHFNPKLKTHMSKAAYVKNTTVGNIASMPHAAALLEYFYENVTSAPFIHARTAQDAALSASTTVGSPTHTKGNSVPTPPKLPLPPSLGSGDYDMSLPTPAPPRNGGSLFKMSSEDSGEITGASPGGTSGNKLKSKQNNLEPYALLTCNQHRSLALGPDLWNHLAIYPHHRRGSQPGGESDLASPSFSSCFSPVSAGVDYTSVWAPAVLRAFQRAQIVRTQTPSPTSGGDALIGGMVPLDLVAPFPQQMVHTIRVVKYDVVNARQDSGSSGTTGTANLSAPCPPLLSAFPSTRSSSSGSTSSSSSSDALATTLIKYSYPNTMAPKRRPSTGGKVGEWAASFIPGRSQNVFLKPKEPKLRRWGLLLTCSQLMIFKDVHYANTVHRSLRKMNSTTPSDGHGNEKHMPAKAAGESHQRILHDFAPDVMLPLGESMAYCDQETDTIPCSFKVRHEQYWGRVSGARGSDGNIGVGEKRVSTTITPTKTPITAKGRRNDAEADGSTPVRSPPADIREKGVSGSNATAGEEVTTAIGKRDISEKALETIDQARASIHGATDGMYDSADRSESGDRDRNGNMGPSLIGNPNWKVRTFLIQASSLEERDDWLIKINFASTLRWAQIGKRDLTLTLEEISALTRMRQRYEEAQRNYSLSFSSHEKQQFSSLPCQLPGALGVQASHTAGGALGGVEAKLSARLSSARRAVDALGVHRVGLLRQLQHMSILTPLRKSTRESVINAVSQLAQTVRRGYIHSVRNQVRAEILLLPLDMESTARSSDGHNMGQNKGQNVRVLSDRNNSKKGKESSPAKVPDACASASAGPAEAGAESVRLYSAGSVPKEAKSSKARSWMNKFRSKTSPSRKTVPPPIGAAKPHDSMYLTLPSPGVGGVVSPLAHETNMLHTYTIPDGSPLISPTRPSSSLSHSSDLHGLGRSTECLSPRSSTRPTTAPNPTVKGSSFEFFPQTASSGQTSLSLGRSQLCTAGLAEEEDQEDPSESPLRYQQSLAISSNTALQPSGFKNKSGKIPAHSHGYAPARSYRALTDPSPYAPSLVVSAHQDVSSLTPIPPSAAASDLAARPSVHATSLPSRNQA